MVNIIGLLIPLLGTMLGAAFSFFMKSPIEREKSDARIDSSEREVARPKVKRDMPERLQKALLENIFDNYETKLFQMVQCGADSRYIRACRCSRLAVV